jgi:PAS domain S-box-containing protein
MDSAGALGRMLVAGSVDLFDLLPAPVLLVELDSARVLFANAAAQAMANGRYPPGLAERVARGERIAAEQIEWQAPGGARTLVVNGEAVVMPDGERVGMVTIEDVTEIEAARRRSAILAEASGALADSFDLTQTLRTIGRLVVPRWADWCFVELLQPDGSIERALMEHSDPERRAFAEEYDRRFPLDPGAPGGSAQVIRSGEPELLPEIPEAFLEAVAEDAEQLRLLRGVGFRSSLIVPLRVRGEVIGDLALVMAESGRRFGEDDLQAAQQLANRCALAIANARLVGELRAKGEEQLAILEGVADSITAQAPDGKLVYANQAAVRELGFASAAELLAAPLGELMSHYDVLTPEGDPFPLERLPGRRALAGETPEPVIVRFRYRDAPAARRWARIKARPVLDEAGRPRLAINVIEDITEIKQTEEAQRFLAEAGRVLAASLDYEQTLQTVAQLAVPVLADWCGIDLLGEDGEIHQVAVAHSDPAKIALAERLREEYPVDPEASALTRVMHSGRSELYAEVTDEMIAAAARDAAHERIIRELGMRSVIVAPMRVRDRTIGSVTFVSAESERRFDEHDVVLAEAFALRAAFAVDNARLYRTRSAIAQTLQASLLPPLLPDIPGVELGAIYRAAGEGYEVGGDFYDLFSTSDGHWFVVVGDVQGKGAEAAAVTALARYTIRAAAVRRRSPAAILRWVSEVMMRREHPDDRFCTIACVHLDVTRSPIRLMAASGGHPLPLVLHADGSVNEVGVPGTLLGLVERLELEDRAADLRPDDTLVLYTDGLTEASAPAEMWSPDQLARVLGSLRGRDAQGVADGLLERAVPDVARPARALRDDIAIIALRAAAQG